MTMGSTLAAAPRAEVSSTADTFDAFYRKLYPRVAIYFDRQHVRSQDVDDLTQTTLMCMLVVFDGTDPADRENRLFLIAHNKFVDYMRGGKRREVSVPVNELSDRPCPVTDPASVVVRMDEARLVRLAVEGEEPRTQALINGRYVLDREYGDIADDLGTTTDALRQLMMRTHNRLRRRLVALDVRSLAPSIPALPFVGWRWTRRSAAPPWMAAAGHGAFVSLVATTMVMAPPSAVPAVAAPIRDAANVSTVERPEPPQVAIRVTERPDFAQQEQQDAGSALGDTDPESVDYGKKGVEVPVPQVSLRPEPPCVGVCEKPAETFTVHDVPGHGDVTQGQNIVPACRHVPPEQSVVTCREDEGTQYAVSPPPRPPED